MSTKKRILVMLIVAVLAAIVIFPMLPLEYREAIASFFAHPLYYPGPPPPSFRERHRPNQRVSGIRSVRGRLPPTPRR